MRILGIDPGINGAAAVYLPLPIGASAEGEVRWHIADLPTVGEDAQRRINAPALRDWLKQFTIAHAYIELAQVMPSIPDAQGERRWAAAAGSFRYGRAAGAIDATVSCCDIPINYVAPISWKRHYGIRGSDKEQSRELAIKKFPSMAQHLERVKDQHRAEAMLIAFYGATVSAEPPLLRAIGSGT